MLGSARSAFMKKSGSIVTLPSALVAYALNEGTGTTSADASGNGHILTLNNATWTTGHTSNGLTDPGHVAGASTPLNAPAAAITLMGWIKPLDLTPNGGATNTHHAFGYIDSGGSSDVTVFSQRNDGALGFPPNVLLINIRLGGSLVGVSGNAMTVGVWTHVAVTYDGATIKLYENGVVTNSVSGSGTVSPGDNLWVAGWSDTSFNGNLVVDDVRAFNTALSGAQVTLAMNTPVS
jgi:hypothetical protein